VIKTQIKDQSGIELKKVTMFTGKICDVEGLVTAESQKERIKLKKKLTGIVKIPSSFPILVKTQPIRLTASLMKAQNSVK